MSEDTEKKLPKISRATHTRFKAFVKSLLKDDGVDGEVMHQMLESIRLNVSKELAGEFLMDLIRTVSDPDADIVEASYWCGPINVKYHNAFFTSWYKFLDDEDMVGHVTFDCDLYNKLDTEVENKDSAMHQMLHFKWQGDEAQNKKAQKRLKALYKWMRDDINGVEPKPKPKSAPKPSPKSDDEDKPKRWWQK